jgi:hypothetical protein
MGTFPALREPGSTAMLIIGSAILFTIGVLQAIGICVSLIKICYYLIKLAVYLIVLVVAGLCLLVQWCARFFYPSDPEPVNHHRHL